MPARTDEGYIKLTQVAALLQELEDMGEEVAIVGKSIVATSGRVGWARDSSTWVTRQYPKRFR